MKLFFREHWLLLLILCFAGVLRLILPNSSPPAIGGDELQYILNSKAFWVTGKDLTGTISVIAPLVFRYPPGIFPQAELPYLLFLPVVGLTHFSLSTARVTNSFLSIGIVLVMYILVKELFGKKVALIAALLTTINPWMIVIGRTAYEAVPAMLFYLAGLVVLLKAKGNKLFFSLPLLLAGFYSYIGTKVILLPIVFIALWYRSILHKKESKRLSIILILLVVIFLVIYFILLRWNSSGSRLSELLTPFSPQIQHEVDRLRQGTVTAPGTSLFENKITIYIKEVIDKMLSIFSFNYLFVTGDGFFGLWRHGLFYYADLLLLLVGAGVLWFKKRKHFILLTGLALIGVLPQIIHKQKEIFSPHITMMIPFFIIIMAYGASEGFNYFSRFQVKKVLVGAASIIYVLSFIYFSHLYFLQYPLQGTYDFPVRVLSRYAFLESENKINISVFTHRPQDLYEKYLFYTDGYSEKRAEGIRNALRNKIYKVDNITFTGCGELLKQQGSTSVQIADALCANDSKVKPDLLVARFEDSSGVYKIYHDSLCLSADVHKSFSSLALSNFNVEGLSGDEFCKTLLLRQ